jgi:HlyD family secretion protein
MTRGKIVGASVGLIAVVGVAAYIAAAGRSRHLEASGTIEARTIRVGSRVGGRVRAVHVREGDRLSPGQPIVTFEDEELAADLAQARATFDKMQRGYRSEEIAEARAAAARAGAELMERRRGYRREQVAAARAAVERARAEAERALRERQRIETLASEGIASAQQRDEARAAHEAADAMVRQVTEHLAELERGYRPEQIAAAEARAREAQAVLRRVEHGFRHEEIAQAKAALDGAAARYRERVVASPADAYVEVLDVRPGDLVTPNAPVAALLEREQLYLRVYVPEPDLGRVRVGQRADVRLDAVPGRTFEAVVDQINHKAEFLPRNVQTREERAHQVFGVKLRLRDPSGTVHAGMAADVVFR